MTNLRQAAQQALEALIPLANAACPNERECLTDEDHERAAEALEALCAALAEPEQEPDGISWLKRDSGYFTAPTPRKPLTDEALHQVIRAGNYDSMEQFARAIERAHGIGEQDD